MKKFLLIGDGVETRFHPLTPVEPVLRGIFPEADWTVRYDYPALADEPLKFDLLVNYADMWGFRDTRALSEALLRWITDGGRMLLLHGGIIRHGDDGLAALYGGTFTGHPEQSVLHYRAEGALANAASFDLMEEPYRFELIDELPKQIALTYEQNGQIYPAGWTTRIGQGKLCYLSIGHTEASFKHPDVQAMLHLAVEWCLG